MRCATVILPRRGRWQARSIVVAAMCIGGTWRAMENASADVYYTPGDIAYNQGADLFDAGRYREAIPHLTNAIRLYRGPNEVSFGGMAYYTRGRAWHALEEYDSAISDFNEAIRMNALELGKVYFYRGQTWTAKKEYDRARADYLRSTMLAVTKPLLEKDAGNIDTHQEDAYNALAWMCATHPDAKYRDGKKAFEYASKAHQLSGGTQPNFLDTLAAAYAECGDFEAAKTTQMKAIKLVDPSHVEEFRRRLELYEQRKPYRAE